MSLVGWMVVLIIFNPWFRYCSFSLKKNKTKKTLSYHILIMLILDSCDISVHTTPLLLHTGLKSVLLHTGLKDVLLHTGLKDVLLHTGLKDVLLHTGLKDVLLHTGLKDVLLHTGLLGVCLYCYRLRRPLTKEPSQDSPASVKKMNLYSWVVKGATPEAVSYHGYCVYAANINPCSLSLSHTDGEVCGVPPGDKEAHEGDSWREVPSQAAHSTATCP